MSFEKLKERPGQAMAYTTVISVLSSVGVVAQALRWEWFTALCGVS